MDFNNEETPKLNLGKEKRMANANSLPIAILGIVGLVLIVALVFFIFYKPDDNAISNKVEISLNVSDVKVGESSLKCEPDEQAIKDAQNIKLSYKKSEQTYYYGNYTDLIDDNGDYVDPGKDKYKQGVEMVIENITDNIYVYIEFTGSTGDADGMKYTSKEAENGRVVKSFNAFKTTDVSVYVYENNENCERLLKHYDVILPRYNVLSTDKKCSTKVGQESKYCAEYTYEQFDEKVLDKLEEGKKEDSSIDVVSIVIVFVLFVIGGVVIFIKLR